jgi:hypothetical protein
MANSCRAPDSALNRLRPSALQRGSSRHRGRARFCCRGFIAKVLHHPRRDSRSRQIRRGRPFAELRTSCRVRTTTLYQRLAAMIADGIVVKSADGYSLSAH